MKFQLDGRLRLRRGVPPLLDGIDRRVYKQRVASNHFDLFHQPVGANDRFDLYGAGQTNMPRKGRVSRWWVLDRFAFFLRVANGSNRERQYEASEQRHSCSQVPGSDKSHAAHTPSMW